MADIETFEGIYRKYFKYVISIVNKYINNPHDVEDIVSNVFLHLWEDYENLDTNSNIKSYIFLITKRRVIDFLRKQYKIREQFIEIEEEVFINLESRKNDHKDNKTLNNIVESLINELPDKYQKIFKYKYLENLSSRDISQKLNISISNVKVINNRLIKKLKEAWQNLN